MEKQYEKPTLELIEWKLNDVILYSPPQETEPYEVDIKRVMKEELEDAGLPPENTELSMP